MLEHSFQFRAILLVLCLVLLSPCITTASAKIWGGFFGKKAPSVEYESAYEGFSQQYRIAPIKKLYLDRLQDEVNQYNYYYALMTSKAQRVENWPKYSDTQKAKQEFIRDMIVSWVGG